jgi:DNA-binding GntR family transcriptional regulator
MPTADAIDKRRLHASDVSEGVAMEVLQQHSLNALVQRALERRILSGELAPGTKLVETDIAAALGVSRGPVREAFRTLAQSGLVHTEKNRGVRVRELAPEDVNDLYEVRAVLDGLIGRLAAKRIGRAQLARLREIVKEMRVVDRARDADAYFPLNIEFHDILAEASGGSYRQVVNELTLYRRQTLTRNSENIPISTREHAAVVDALAAANAPLAERLLFEHVIASRDRLHRALAMPPPARRKPARAGA